MVEPAVDRRVSIYGLRDPRTSEIRYVGQSIRPDTRRKAHISNARRGDETYRGRWIRTLLEDGLEPALVILEADIIGGLWEAAEQAWIDYIRTFAGDRLTNLTAGGEGCVAMFVSEETRAKRSASLRGKKRTPETCERMGAWQRGKPGRKWTDESKAKMSATRTGVPHSPEWSANISKAKKGKPLSEAHIEALRVSRNNRCNCGNCGKCKQRLRRAIEKRKVWEWAFAV